MNKVNLKRIIESCKKSRATLSVKDVAEIIEASVKVLYNTGTILKKVERKIGEEDFNALVTSCLGTLLTNIYINAEKDVDIVEFGNEIGASGSCIVKKEKRGDEA